MPQTGELGARAAVASAARQLQLVKERRGTPDPPIGRPRGDAPPGQWVPDEWGLPPDCPVQPLGYDGQAVYLIDALGQLVTLPKTKELGQDFIQKIFANRQGYIWWAWPRFGKDQVVTGFDAVKVRGCFYSAAGAKGLWRAEEKVRGLGAWTDKMGRLIYHAGDALYVDGKPQLSGVAMGPVFYPRRPSIPGPWPGPVGHEDNPARQMLKHFRTWSWDRPTIDPLIMVGFLGAALLGGALPWRPSVFVTGDKGVGKSMLQNIIKDVLGPAIISTPDTTPAGIYQRVGSDAIAIAVDELEAEANNTKAAAIVKLVRLAASGGMMLRGGADHQGVEFQARSTFLLSAINAPYLPPQDLSRLCVMSLHKIDLEKVKSRPVIEAAETIAPMLLRRLMDNWHRFPTAWEDYRAALRTGGHDSRGQDTYGTFLALADLLLGPEGLDEAGYPVDDLNWWGSDAALSVASLPDVDDARENWRACLTHLFTSRVEAWRSGERQTVGQLLEDFSGPEDTAPSLARARRDLAQAGLGLVEPGKACKGPALAIPYTGPLIASLFKGTPWGSDGVNGVWGPAIRMGPRAVVITDRAKTSLRINGLKQRCVLVDLDAFRKLTEE